MVRINIYDVAEVHIYMNYIYIDREIKKKKENNAVKKTNIFIRINIVSQ